jgi:uncharacterized protein YjbI with pentapeptide repeats
MAPNVGAVLTAKLLTPKELLERYASGERDFTGATFERDSIRGDDLVEAKLNGLNLSRANLQRANLQRANLAGADLSGANLEQASLERANLFRADLSGANLKGAHLLDARLLQANLTGALLNVPEITGKVAGSVRGAYLVCADLRYADLHGADMRGAHLSCANLTGANLSGADLAGTELDGVRLTDANLSRADLSRANLRGADLTRANLTRANLNGVEFADAKLSEARLNATILSDVDLTPILRAPINFEGRNEVDWRTVIRSVKEPQLKDFMRRSGMPDVFVEYMVACARSLDPQIVFSLMQSTFISYGGPDEAFARKLNEALKRGGVTTFFFKDDAPPGERLHRVMHKGVNEHNRTILICSEASLQRPGLLNELEETLEREALDGGQTYLIPVRVDDYVLDGWAPGRGDLARRVRGRVIADFRRHEDRAEFDSEVAKLIAVLKKPITHR